MIKFRIYFNWFLVNAIFCLLPIIVSAFIAGGVNENIFSSVLSYAFTLTIASLYLYERYIKPENTFKIAGYIFAFVLIICYVIYPELLSKNQLLAINENSRNILLSCLLITLILSFIMNYKDMNRTAKDIEQEKKYKDKLDKGDGINTWMAEQKRKEKNG
jgi:hypothetical protein